MKRPFISVIVTAYNRKEFLLEALQSAVNQTSPRDSYEIICIKNFNDQKIDKYIKDNEIISIVRDGTIGEYLYLAAKKAKGEILVFLDDDDLISKDKLERVNFVFSRYNTIGFYHNSQLKGENPQKDFSRLYEKKFKIVRYPYKNSFKYLKIATFNLSSIAIKKCILFSHLNELKSVIASPDSFMLIISLISKTDIFIDYDKYTFYRLHSNNTSYFKSLEKNLRFNKEIELPALLYQLNLANHYASNPARVVLKHLIFMNKSDIAIKENKKKEVISTFRNLPLNAVDKSLLKRVILSILFLFGSNYPYKRLTRNFNQDKDYSDKRK
jgi:glycosyltransferase involved in cell wall biosynthesis